jgi:hypothetical protein
MPLETVHLANSGTIFVHPLPLKHTPKLWRNTGSHELRIQKVRCAHHLAATTVDVELMHS